MSGWILGEVGTTEAKKYILCTDLYSEDFQVLFWLCQELYTVSLLLGKPSSMIYLVLIHLIDVIIRIRSTLHRKLLWFLK
uniref:Uncharacterized protein n=1 Tax=Arundo donax TaxID=35708 RepID=A0A0A9GU25_ARUDO